MQGRIVKVDGLLWIIDPVWTTDPDCLPAQSKGMRCAGMHAPG